MLNSTTICADLKRPWKLLNSVICTFCWSVIFSLPVINWLTCSYYYLSSDFFTQKLRVRYEQHFQTSQFCVWPIAAKRSCVTTSFITRCFCVFVSVRSFVVVLHILSAERVAVFAHLHIFVPCCVGRIFLYAVVNLICYISCWWNKWINWCVLPTVVTLWDTVCVRNVLNAAFTVTSIFSS